MHTSTPIDISRPLAPLQQDNVVSIPDLSLSTMMRKRAHLQFASIRAGNGPIPTGQPAKERMAVSRQRTSPVVVSVRKDATSIVNLPKVRSSPSRSNLSSTSETSATGAPRTLRAKPSFSTLSRSSEHITVQSNPPTSNNDSKSGRGQMLPGNQGAPPRYPQHINKRDSILNSPVMSAMLRSKAPQKRIPHSGSDQYIRSSDAQDMPCSVISGNGIRVKATHLKNDQKPGGSSSHKGQGSPSVRVKTVRQLDSVRSTATFASTNLPAHVVSTGQARLH